MGDSVSGNVDVSGFLTAPILDCAPILDIDKQVVPLLQRPGDPLTYTVAFSNTGDIAAQNVVISDSVPLSVTITGVVSSTYGGATIVQTSGAPDFVWSVGTLPVGSGGVITLTGVVTTNTGLAGQVVTNTVVLAADSYPTIQASAAPYRFCGPGTYLDIPTNSCFDAPAGRFVADFGATEATPCQPGTYQPDTGQAFCLLAPINTYVPFSAATTPTDCPAGTFNPTQGAASVDACRPLAEALFVAKSVSDVTPAQGDTITYTVRITNSTSVSLTNAIISDTTPTELSFVGGSTTVDPSGGTTGDAPQLVSGLTIMAGSSVTVTYRATVQATGDQQITNTVSLTATQMTQVITDTATITFDDVCDPFPSEVATFSELNQAITCFNAVSVAGTYVVSFSADITLQTDLPTVDNTTAGVALQIEGDGFILNGQNEIRLLTIASNTTVGINALTLQNGNALSENGGAIETNGTLTVENSTFVGNRATFAGGAVRVNTGTTTFRNVTVSQNESTDSFGGGVRVNGGTFFSYNSTFIDNFEGGGGGANIDNSGTLHLLNSLLSSSDTASDCANFNGTIATNINNLIEDGSCNATVSGNPNVGALQDNGGLTPTHLPTFDSIAIDAGDNTTCIATDQRGEVRDDLNCDVGAVEVKYADTNVVEKTLAMGDGFTFGPTFVGITDTTTNRIVGTATVTKTLIPPPDLFGDTVISATWEIEATGSLYSATLTICYLDSELPAGTDENGLSLFRSTAPNEWQLVASVVDPASNCVTAEGVTEFSRWAIADPDATLVDLQEIHATSFVLRLNVVVAMMLVGITMWTWQKRRNNFISFG